MNERLLDYLLDELDPDERAAFEAYPARMAEAERLRPIVTRLESLDREEWDPPEAPALACRARRAARDRRGRRAGAGCCPSDPWSRPASRSLLLAVGVGAGLLLGGRDAGGAPTAARARA